MSWNGTCNVIKSLSRWFLCTVQILRARTVCLTGLIVSGTDLVSLTTVF